MAASNDIAIIGMSFKLPEDADNELGFWKILEGRRNVMTEWPPSRTNIDAFYNVEPGSQNRLQHRGGHFLKQDPAGFDAPFFSITTRDAAAMDPQHRLILETSYGAFENAGIPIDRLKGTRTAVFAASMSDDYTRMLAKDPDTIPRSAIQGVCASILPSRVSWYFDLIGPSVHIDTACSSTMVALDLACQSIKSGDSDMALVAGANLMLGPEGSILLSGGNFLSTDSVCWSFDERANGYARGEAIIGMVIKPVEAAIRDGDMIRAVIRSSGCNQDGRTPGMTQPSAEAQEQLIRHVYRKAGLGLEETRFFEAHGTGTPVGDPIEMKAIGRVFHSSRSPEEPLYVGSLKANFGHLEASSGLAGVVKSVLVLEKGVIPPNALFEEMNLEIDADFYNVTVPKKSTPWPAEGLRRVSVNSFGFGGTNSHVVMDDALHYLQSRNLQGNHCTRECPPFSIESQPKTNGHQDPNALISNGHNIHNGHNGHNGHGSNGLNGHSSYHSCKESSSEGPKLLVWSAADEKALGRTKQVYEPFYNTRISGSSTSLAQFAYTLAARRSHLLWRTFALCGGDSGDDLSIAKPSRSSSENGLAFIFTGQGAQYANMGLELLHYPIFEQTLRKAEQSFRSFGATWGLFDALANVEKINAPEYSQPLCTALQIALVELLRSFNLVPCAVAGHSSGEIAAAYAAGALNLDAACRIAFFRGKLAGELKSSASANGSPGAMLSANLAESDVSEYLLNSGFSETSVHVACINSPLNVTLSGLENDIDRLKSQLDEDEIFSQKLKTGVAYHSPAMKTIQDEYLKAIGCIDTSNGKSGHLAIPMVSSVNGKTITSRKALTDPMYWITNLVSPVRFCEAVTTLTKGELRIGMPTLTDVVEVGPHSALRRPILDILKKESLSIRYGNVIQRSKSSLKGAMELAGQLFCHGHSVSITAVNQQLEPLPFRVDCPEYPFDHSRTYWAESRLSKDYRLRDPVPNDSLGQRALDWNPLEPTWRKFLSVESIPWAKDHVVTGTTLYPGAGMIVMALEAARQMCPENRSLAGLLMREAHFLNPMIVGNTREEATEAVIRLQPLQKPYEKESVWFSVKIFSVIQGRWTECFRADIQLQYQEEGIMQVDRGMEKTLSDETIRRMISEAEQSCTEGVFTQDFYDNLHTTGLGHGESFQLLENIQWDGNEISMAKVNISESKHRTDSLVHPTILDCAMQLPILSATKNFTHSIGAAVPSQMKNVWFSSSGWNQSDTKALRILTKGTPGPGGRGVSVKTVHIVSEDGSPLCVMQGMAVKSVSGRQDTEGDEKKLLHGIEHQPQLSLLSNEELASVSRANVFTENEVFVRYYRITLNAALDVVVRKTVRQLTPEDRLKTPEFLRRHVEWMDNYVVNKQSPTGFDFKEENLDQILQEVEDLRPSWKIYPVIARNIESILRGETDPLALVFGTDGSADDSEDSSPGVADIIYADIFSKLCDDKFKRLLDLATHERPTMRILEVGAGTGGVTRHVFSAFRDCEKRCGGLKFTEYTYTDISPSFFESAQAEFDEFAQRLIFKSLDLERPPEEQGFAPGTYDMVIAGSVLHATADLTRTMNHVRSLLKPGGHMIIIEVTAPESVAVNFAFGCLPGWWSCQEEWRRWCPAITEKQWDQLLRSHGFVGNRLVLRDYKSEVCHDMSVIFSTLAEEPAPDSDAVWILVPDQRNDDDDMLIKSIRDRLSHRDTKLLPLSQFNDTILAENDIIISLLEIRLGFLVCLTEEQFTMVQRLIKSVDRIMWIMSSRRNEDHYPDFDVMRGFFRAMRSENIDKHIVTLGIEDAIDPVRHVGYIKDVFTASFEKGSNEVEYWAWDGFLNTARLIEEAGLNKSMRSLVSPQFRQEGWGKAGPALKLSVGIPGFLDSLEFIEDQAYTAELGPEEIEVEAKAWGLSFRDVFVALGRLEGDELGYDFAGIVTRTGSACDKSIKPGDRVCGSALSCMRTYPRTSSKMVIKVPDSLSLEAASSFISPGITAYYSLIQVARLQKGEKILIHSASGSTGQMAIWIAKMVGAEIFATVGFDDKKQLLVDEFGIPEDHIFYSRNVSFAQGIMRMTSGKGVDVILNSLSGDGLRASWECIAAYGRFIEIGKADITANSTLPMGSFAGNVTFSAVDLFHVAQTNQNLAHSLLESTMKLLAESIIHHPSPLHVYRASNIEQAFRYLQSGKNTGRIIISVNEDDVVPKRIVDRSKWTLDPNASYLVAGGLGGIGRAILLWLADKGAKHLIVPSRSGGSSSEAAAEAIAELQRRGVNILTPKCDVADADSFSSVLSQCSQKMPAIKGCINAAMVLQDAVLSNMTYAQWDLTMRSKVATSWNLHKQLPNDLDFFVLLSSLNGIYGGIAQSNYAAGCTFQDALARFRISAGQKAVSFDIGWMHNIGIIAETPAYQQQRKVQGNMGLIEDTELLALLDLYCDPSHPLLDSDKSQILIGAVTPSDVLASGGSPPPQTLVPLFATFSQILNDGAGSAGGQGAVDNFAAMFRKQDATPEERAEVVVRSLVTKLSRALSIAADDVDVGKHLSDYGVDSLMAVELRNWITKDFEANVAVFEIMGGTKIKDLGELVVEKSQVGTGQTESQGS